jgi:hypothetical protein
LILKKIETYFHNNLENSTHFRLGYSTYDNTHNLSVTTLPRSPQQLPLPHLFSLSLDECSKPLSSETRKKLNDLVLQSDSAKANKSLAAISFFRDERNVSGLLDHKSQLIPMENLDAYEKVLKDKRILSHTLEGSEKKAQGFDPEAIRAIASGILAQGGFDPDEWDAFRTIAPSEFSDKIQGSVDMEKSAASIHSDPDLDPSFLPL